MLPLVLRWARPWVKQKELLWVLQWGLLWVPRWALQWVLSTWVRAAAAKSRAASARTCVSKEAMFLFLS